MARPQAALLDVYDVDRLEILRGPQGTLYGKNTIAGAIKYVTRDITGPATVTASLTGGNYGERDEKLTASTPVIADHVYFGIALADLHHDGYGHVVAQAGTTPSPYNSIGQDVSNRDVLAGRANLTVAVGRELETQAGRRHHPGSFERLRRRAAQQCPRAPDRQPLRHAHRHAGGSGPLLPQRPGRRPTPKGLTPGPRSQAGRRLPRGPRPAVHRLRGIERESVPGARRSTASTRPRAKAS